MSAWCARPAVEMTIARWADEKEQRRFTDRAKANAGATVVKHQNEEGRAKSK